MPKKHASEHSTSYAERYADETVSDSKQSNFELDHPPDDWRQTDFAHRFTDELKAINDSAAANFDSTKKLTEYTGDERKQLAYATAEAFRSMDFESKEAKVEAALDLSHTLLDPIGQEIRLEESHLRQTDIDILKRAGVNHVVVAPPNQENPEAFTYDFVVENRDMANVIGQLTGAKFISEEESKEPQTSYSAKYIDIFADRFAFELLSDPATHDNDIVGNSLQEILDQAVAFAKDPSLSDKDVISYDHISQEQDPYARDILLDLAAQAPMQDVRREIFVLQHTDPETATAAQTATEAVTSLYRDQLERVLESGTQDDFEKVTQHMTDFATTFAAAAKDPAAFTNAESGDKPDLPDSFPNPSAAMEYIDNIKDTLDHPRSPEGQTRPHGRIRHHKTRRRVRARQRHLFPQPRPKRSIHKRPRLAGDDRQQPCHR